MARPQAILGIDNRFLTQKKFTTTVAAIGQKIKTLEHEGVALPEGFSNEIELFDFCVLAAPWVVIGQRDRLERDNTIRQVLPYTPVGRRHPRTGELEILSYQRTQQVGEERLGGKWSIAFGGHVDFAGVRADDHVINLYKTVYDNIERERDEELVFFYNGRECTPGEVHTQCTVEEYGFILDSSDEVGQVHLAMVNLIIVPYEWEAKCREAELVTGRFLTPAMHLATGSQFENWSQILLEKMANVGQSVTLDPYYVRIEDGDTLSELSLKHGKTIDALLRYNPHITDPNLIRAGDILRLRELPSHHVVSNGDTWGDIAKKYGVDLAFLMGLNAYRPSSFETHDSREGLGAHAVTGRVHVMLKPRD